MKQDKSQGTITRMKMSSKIVNQVFLCENVTVIVMAGSWTAEETQALIAIWGQEAVQDKLSRVHRNHNIILRISMELEDYGFSRTWQQC